MANLNSQQASKWATLAAYLLRLLSIVCLFTLIASGKDVPPCSTEKVNNDCVVNIDRRYPITMPTFQMRPGKHIRVTIHYAFHFETLTLDPQTPQALQGSDQGAALVTAAIPNLKGLQVITKTTFSLNEFQPQPVSPLTPSATASAAERHVIDRLNDLKTKLASIQEAASDLPDQIREFDDEAAIIYAQLKEIVSSVPRPVANTDNHWLPGTGVPKWSLGFDPWADYPRWRSLLLYELSDGNGSFTPPTPEGAAPEVPEDVIGNGNSLIAGLPTAAGNGGSASKSTTPNPFSEFESEASSVKTEINNLNDATLQSKYQPILDDLVAQEQQTANALTPVSAALAKVTSDLQTYLANINYWTGDASQTGITVDTNGNDQPVQLGFIPDPISADKKLAPYKALGRQITYTLNAENQIATSPLAVPTATQKAAIVTITALYADPRFEISAGAFVSSMPNRSFANFTDVKSVPGGTPSPVDIRIKQTISRPELLPFAAANYRLGRDFIMPGQRRGAVYGTLAFALNPYNQLPEFGAGFSLSWRSFMFSPLYHLGHDVHLTQGEYVNEIWCNYGVPPGSVPPPCGSPPPAPSTKTYWRGAFALGISIRVPTTFGAGH